MSKKPRIGIVVQRYGEDVNGGAELHARWLAEHLLEIAEVHAITTCARDVTWENEYAPGRSLLNGVIVHRFPVDAPRTMKQQKKETRFILREAHSVFDEIAWVKAQGPYSSPLFDFLTTYNDAFDIFIFVTFLYATTYFGLPLVAGKAILIPTAHDDPYLPLPAYRALFHLPELIVYNTETERSLVNRLTQNGHRQQDIIAGTGINVPADINGDRFRQKYQIAGDFILYVGRINESKNMPELLEDFCHFRRQYAGELKLILIGTVYIDLPDHPDIVPLGFVSEQDKFDAIQAATAVVMPSLYESLSMIVLESWLIETPVLVNGRCAVLKQQCRRSNGGLYYHVYDEFELALTRLLQSPALCRQLGKQGKQFTEKYYSWSHILNQFKAAFARIPASQTNGERA